MASEWREFRASRVLPVVLSTMEGYRTYRTAWKPRVPDPLQQLVLFVTCALQLLLEVPSSSRAVAVAVGPRRPHLQEPAS